MAVAVIYPYLKLHVQKTLNLSAKVFVTTKMFCGMICRCLNVEETFWVRQHVTSYWAKPTPESADLVVRMLLFQPAVAYANR